MKTYQPEAFVPCFPYTACIPMAVSSQEFPKVDSPNRRRNSKGREYFLLCFEILELTVLEENACVIWLLWLLGMLL